MQLNYFKEEEFARCNPSCSSDQMDKDFLLVLDCCRADAGVPFVLSSCYRSPEHDRSRGRSGKGYHTLGRAADIRCTDSYTRSKILAACLRYGLSCGISKTFIHVDNRPNQIVFLY